MLVNNKNNKVTSHVKFIEYTGEYPNLCRGVLTLEIDGVQYKFGHNYNCYHPGHTVGNGFSDEDQNNPNFDSFWTSGGDVTRDDDWNFDVCHGEWEIDANDIPEQFRQYASEIDSVFNQNVEYGCCGGCI